MTVHSTAFPDAQPVAAARPPPRTLRAQLPAAAKKLNLRKLLLTGAALPRWPARPGMAGITGPSASIWSPPTTPM